MVWVKICGIRDVATARQVAACRPDAIGLNFYPHSSRLVSPETADSIVRELPADIEPVGVFVNAAAAEAAEIVRRCGLRRAQFHGDEPPEQLAEFHRLSPRTSIVRAWRGGATGLQPLADYVARCAALQVPISAVLLDANVPGEYGGTGTLLPWDAIRRESATLALPPLVLAGGLTAENVAAAVQTVSPWGVDVASGVESSPAVKDPVLVARFVERARSASGGPIARY